MKAIVTVIGKDRVGIIASVCALMASHNVNILDISQNVMDDMFAMVMFVDISKSTVEFDKLTNAMEVVSIELGMKIHCMHEDIFNAMHRI